MKHLEAIFAAEKLLLDYPQVEMTVTHYQIDGVYVRSLFIPKDVILTGRIHNKESIAILAQGTIKVCNGLETKTLTAPHIMIDQPGVKRIGYALEDCVFITVHRTDESEIERIEDELTSLTLDDYVKKTARLEERI
jgi:hypothetical protein